MANPDSRLAGGGSPGARLTPSFDIDNMTGSVFLAGTISMYAVIKTGGKQYRVAVGEKLKVEQIPADIGAVITLEEVLAVGKDDGIVVGAPLVPGASVAVTVLSHGRGDKVRIFKMRRRKHYQKHQGHRQNYTELRIDEIRS